MKPPSTKRLRLAFVRRRLQVLADGIAYRGLFCFDIAPELAAARIASADDVDVALTARPLGPIERLTRWADEAR